MSGANAELFNAEEYAGTPLLQAIEQLCAETGKTVAQLETVTMGEIVEMAKAQYRDQLPEIWQIWIDWNQDDQIQPMGDL